MSERGVVYIAYGAPARRETEKSIKSLRRVHPALPVTVVSDAHFGMGVNLRRVPERDMGGRWQKTRAYEYSPYELTLLLDADTRVHGTIDTGFAALADGYELAVTASVNAGERCLWHVAEADREAAFNLYEADNLLAMQGGVIFFRKCRRVQRFFQAWAREWARYGDKDMGALQRAIYYHPLRVWWLGYPWNGVKGGAVIAHHFGAAQRDRP